MRQLLTQRTLLLVLETAPLILVQKWEKRWPWDSHIWNRHIFYLCQPGESKSVTLVSIGGKRVIKGGNGIVDGLVDGARWGEILEAVNTRGFGNIEEPNARFRCCLTSPYCLFCFGSAVPLNKLAISRLWMHNNVLAQNWFVVKVLLEKTQVSLRSCLERHMRTCTAPQLETKSGLVILVCLLK